MENSNNIEPSLGTPDNGMATDAQQGLVLDESIDDVNKSVKEIFLKRKKILWAGIVATIAWETLIYFWLVLVPPVDNNDPRAFGFIAPVFIFLGLYVYVHSKVHHEFMQQFAAANGYGYQKISSLDGLSGAVFNIGHSRSVQDFITGEYQGNKFALFNYSYVTGGGKTSETHNNTIFQVPCPNPLPPILLVAGIRFFSNLRPNFPDSEILKLEGDYNKYFTLYTRKEFEIEALEIFTPDFMGKTKDDYKEFSIEFSGQQMYIYYSAFIETKDELQKMFNLIKYLIVKIEPLAQRMASSVKDLEALQKS